MHMRTLSKNAHRTSEDSFAQSMIGDIHPHSSSKTLMLPSFWARPVKYAYRQRPVLIPVGKIMDPNSQRRSGHRSFAHRPASEKPAWLPIIRFEYMLLIPGPGRRSSQGCSFLPVGNPGSTVVENTTRS